MPLPNPPRSPTLEVPRKSVELIDPGAKDLDESSDDGQVFTDARDTVMTPTRDTILTPTRDTVLSPLTIPTTRVEKVDNSPSHGEVPGTPAYEKRLRDAVPDEIEIIPEGKRSRASSRAMASPSPTSPSHSPIPRTRVEKVDPTSPSYGEVPGTSAWEKRKADAMPDAIDVAIPENQSTSSPNQSPSLPIIPKTVLTRVDSEPAHSAASGEAPFESSYFKRVTSEGPAKSPIAEDGGFGPMDYESSSKGSEDEKAEDEGFDDFNEGDGDDFGDFDDFEDGFQEAEVPEEQAVPPVIQSAAVEPPLFPVLDFSSPLSLDSLIEAMKPHTEALFPLTRELAGEAPTSLPESNSAFLSDRSISLWRELVAPPPLQPPNWVRSRIRRLFLVSLGVPVDLDEILPKSKQKKLVLQYSPEAQKGGRQGSVTKKGEATTSNESDTTTSATSKLSSRKRRGPLPPPDFDLSEVHQLCNKTTLDLETMDDTQLEAHVAKLETLLNTGRDVLQYWIRRKEAAVGEKEAFDGVIENLVRHARRVRK